MAIKLHRRDEYRWCMQELDLAGDLRRRTAEAEIRRDPDHRVNREDVWIGGRSVVLQVTDGLLTYFHRIDGDEVSLDLVFDSDPLPKWFVNPPGTWFEDLDLS